ncbi:MAG TPA: hypothetical protein VEA99_08660, partial [Gemmatimonadaceae bacterium]|nr:hypothetical protein [Gemmatimonadaceae bacterium]
MSHPDTAWAEESESILRGLAHALSNRAIALDLAGDALDDEEAEARAAATAQIRGESVRVAELTRLLKLLPREGLGRPQALQVSEVLADAVALHAHHLELRDLPLTTAIAAEALPVRVERWALLRALVLLIAMARRAARAEGSAGGGVAIRVEGTEDETRVACAVGED